MSFNTIPDDCVRLILERICVQHQMQLGVICPRWKLIIESIFRAKRSLFLCDSSNNSNRKVHEDETFKEKLELSVGKMLSTVKRNDPFGCFFLVDLFPNVTALRTEIPSINSFKDIIPLLFSSAWSCTIRKLHLSSHILVSPFIWHQINQLSCLEELRIDFLNGWPDAIPERMTILGKLNHLHIEGIVTNLESILRQLGPELRRLHFDFKSTTFQFDLSQFESFARSSDVFANITHFGYGNGMPECARLKLLQIICTYFKSLAVLHFPSITKNATTEVFTELSRLPNLAKISALNIDSINPFYLRPLKSLKKLRFYFAQTDEQNKSFLKCIPVLFPVLQKLEIAKNVKDQETEVPQFKKKIEAFGLPVKSIKLVH